MKGYTAEELFCIAEFRLQAKTQKVSLLKVEDTQKLLHELQVHQIELEMQNDELLIAKDKNDIALYRYTELFDFASVAFFTLDRSSKITQVNLMGAGLLGLERSRLTGLLFCQYTTPEYRSIFNDFLTKAFDTGKKQNCEILIQVEKHFLWLSLEASIRLTDPDCLVTMTDITECKQADEKLKRAASVFSHAHEGIMITDSSGNITEVNDAFSEITGYSAADMLGKNPIILQSGRQNQEFYAEMWHSIRTKGNWHGEVWNRRKNGELYAEKLTISAVKNTMGIVQHYVSLFSDITLMKEHQGQLEHITHFDVLTNLPNRILLADRLSQAMLQCQRHNQSLAVVFMDLDGFKVINDTFGHNAGDELLIELSQRMKKVLREGDTLARIGGDEFIAVMVDLEKIEDCEPLLTRLLNAAAESVTVFDTLMKVSASIGVTFYPQDGADADQLMRHADQAMYLAKQAGKNRYHMFDTERDNAIKTRHQSIGDVRAALNRREFVLYYQPKVNMRTGKVISVEALIRWQHPNRGLLLPVDFLPSIEGHKSSLELGEWVIGAALNQISYWQTIGINLSVSVNISAYQLQQDDFADRLETLLNGHPDVNPRCIDLEILETSALSNISQVSNTIKACHKMGVRFALDDFGTGYSSLSYLKHLPAYLIKIDQSFVHDMLDDVDDLAIVEGVVSLAKAFQREVLAEGVESVAHGKALLKIGCELAQGFGIARPMPANDIPDWVSNWKADASWQVGTSRLRLC